MTSLPADAAAPKGPIGALVPMLHVTDMERSIQFYSQLGFAVGSFVPPAGPMHWAWLYAPSAADWKRGPNIMLTHSECAISSDLQQVLFYLYASDLPKLHAALLAAGISASAIEHPEYLPAGEFRTQDPDGYILMIAQSTSETP
jgi:catechol 2,3-dioxygenase-like lactoylglutathione lyase family enzyme